MSKSKPGTSKFGRKTTEEKQLNVYNFSCPRKIKKKNVTNHDQCSSFAILETSTVQENVKHCG